MCQKHKSVTFGLSNMLMNRKYIYVTADPLRTNSFQRKFMIDEDSSQRLVFSEDNFITI